MSAQQSYIENEALLRALKDVLTANKELVEKVAASNEALTKTNAELLNNTRLLRKIVRKKFGNGASPPVDGGLLGKAAGSLMGGAMGGLGMLLGADPLAKFAQIAQIVTGVASILLVIGLAGHLNVAVSKEGVIATNPNGGGALSDEILTLLREILGALEGREEWFNATDYRDQVLGGGTWAEKPSLKEMLQAIARQLGVKIDQEELTAYDKDANGNNIQIGIDNDGNPIYQKTVTHYWQAAEQGLSLLDVGQLTLEQLAGTLNLVLPLTLNEDLDGKGTKETPEAFALRQDARAATLASFYNIAQEIHAQLNTETTTPSKINLTIRDLLKAVEVNIPPSLIENERLKTAPDLTLLALGLTAMAGGIQNIDTDVKATNTALGRLETKAEATNTALGTIENDLNYNGVPFSWILNDFQLENKGGLDALKTALGTLETIDGRLHSDQIGFGDQSVALTLKCILGDIQLDNESVFKTIRNLLRNESNSAYLKEILNKLGGFATEATLSSIKGTAESIDAKTVSIDDNISGLAGTIGHGELGDITVYNQLKQILANAFSAKTDLDQIAASIGTLGTATINRSASEIWQATGTSLVNLQEINTKLGGMDPSLFNVVYEMSQNTGGDGCCDEEWTDDGNVSRPEPSDSLPPNPTTDGDIQCKRVEMLLDFYKKWMADFCAKANLTATFLGFLSADKLSFALRGSAISTIRLWAPPKAGLSLVKDPASVVIRYGLGQQIAAFLPHVLITLTVATVVAGQIVHCACAEDFPAMLGLTGSGPYSSLKCTLYNALKEGKTGAEFKALFDAWIDSVVFQGDLTFGLASATRKSILKAFMPLSAATAFVEGKLINFNAAELFDSDGNDYPGDCGCGGTTTPAQDVGHLVSLTSFGGYFGNTSWYFWEVPVGIPGCTNKRNSLSANDSAGTPGFVVIAPFPIGTRRMRIVASDRPGSTLPLPNKSIRVEWNSGAGGFNILPGANQGNWYSLDLAAGATNFNIQASSGNTGLDPTLPPYDFGVEFDPPL